MPVRFTSILHYACFTYCFINRTMIVLSLTNQQGIPTKKRLNIVIKYITLSIHFRYYLFIIRIVNRTIIVTNFIHYKTKQGL